MTGSLEPALATAGVLVDAASSRGDDHIALNLARGMRQKSTSVTGWSGLFRHQFSRCQFEERYLPAVDADAAFGAEPYQRVAAQKTNFRLAFR